MLERVKAQCGNFSLTKKRENANHLVTVVVGEMRIGFPHILNVEMFAFKKRIQVSRKVIGGSLKRIVGI